MACRAQLGLGGFDELMLFRRRRVDAVAGGARQVAPLVTAAFPPRMLATVVAGQARLVDFGGLDLAELANVLLGVIVHVRLAGAVAAFTSMGGFRRARVIRVRVRRTFQGVSL